MFLTILDRFGGPFWGPFWEASGDLHVKTRVNMRTHADLYVKTRIWDDAWYSFTRKKMYECQSRALFIRVFTYKSV